MQIFFNFKDARDKFTKAIQYGSRLAAWGLSSRNPNWEKRFRALFGKYLFYFYISTGKRFKKNISFIQECK
jgi:hypothetical protein